MVRVSASYKGQSATSGVFAIDAAAVASVSVSPSSATVIVGATQQYAALATYSDGSTGGVSGSVSWSSSSPSVASVNGAGLATGVGLGTSSIVATYGSGPGEVSGSGAITVATTPLTLIAIAVTPTSSRLALGTSEQLTATGKYSDGTNRDLTGSAVWTSAVPGVSTVSSSGEVKGVTVGTASITATVGGLSGNATVVVSAATLASVAISPSGVSLAVGASRQFTLTGSFTDGSTQDLTSAVGTVWASADATKATVSSSGLATGVASGSVGISSSYGGKSATTAVNVTAAELVSIAITPSTDSFAKGTTAAVSRGRDLLGWFG